MIKIMVINSDLNGYFCLIVIVVVVNTVCLGNLSLNLCHKDFFSNKKFHSSFQTVRLEHSPNHHKLDIHRIVRLC